MSSKNTQADGVTLQMNGLSSTLDGVAGQVKFNAVAKFITKGGNTSISGKSISVNNADEVTILISIATNFTDYKTLNTDEVLKSRKYISEAEHKNFKTLFKII